MSSSKFNIGTWIKSLTPEEKKAHFDKLQEAKKYHQDKKRRLKMSASEQAREMLPEILAYKMLEDDKHDWTPKPETIQKLKELISKGYTVEQMRDGPFKNVSQRVWDKIVRTLFKNHVGQIEDLGLTLVNSRKMALERLKKRARMIRKEMKLWTKGGKRVPPALFKQLGDVEDQQHSIEVELTKTLYQVEAVGEKAKVGSIVLNFSTPRPKEDENKAIDVTPAEDDDSGDR